MTGILVVLIVFACVAAALAGASVRILREYERAGVAAIHIEDQVWPKKCGFMAGKRVIPAEEHVENVPVTTCRMVAETATRQVPVTVADQIPVTLNRCVAQVVPRTVAVQQCTMVPVAVPACMTCQ